MTTTTFSAAPTNATDAEFRDWGSKFSAALAAVGMVKTADTGTVDWSTVTKPSAINQKKCWEVWRFNDSLQATQPLFVLVEYGSSTVVNYPAIWVTLGKGTNGAGTLTSQFPSSDKTALASASSSPTTWYVSGGGSYVCWSMAPAVALPNQPAGWGVIERGRDSSGAFIGTCFQVTTSAPGSPTVAVCNYANSTRFVDAQCSAFALPTQLTADQSLSFGGGPAATATALLFDRNATFWQSRCMLLGMRQDFASLVPVTVPPWGTFLPLGLAGGNGSGYFNTHLIAWQ